MRTNDVSFVKYTVKYASLPFVCLLIIAFALSLVACDVYLSESESAPEMGIERELQQELDIEVATQELAQEVDIEATTPELAQEVNLNFVTQSVDYIDRIAVVLNPNWHGHVWQGDFTTSYITERAEIEYVYSLLTAVKVVYFNKYPRHYESIQSDSEFLIRLEYSDGATDEFYGFILHEREIVRYLDTRGPHNDPGFIFGRNEEIWDFIAERRPAE